MKPKSAPGLMLVIGALALLIGLAMWSASRRTIRVDDPASTPALPALPDMRIDINAASAAELALLPGLGPALAERIVEDRNHRGPFVSIDELDRVPGIGPAIIDRIRKDAVVNATD